MKYANKRTGIIQIHVCPMRALLNKPKQRKKKRTWRGENRYSIYKTHPSDTSTSLESKGGRRGLLEAKMQGESMKPSGEAMGAAQSHRSGCIVAIGSEGGATPVSAIQRYQPTYLPQLGE